MLLMPQFFHALRSLFIKVESAQESVLEGPCWWCLTAMTNLTMPPDSSGSASPAAFRANATTQRSLLARSPYSFEKHHTLTGRQRLALVFERKPDLRMPNDLLEELLRKSNSEMQVLKQAGATSYR